MDGTEFTTAATEINGGASIGATFLFQLGNLAKNLIGGGSWGLGGRKQGRC
jgi:hypothetical protein